MMTRLLRKLAGTLVGDYRINWIYAAGQANAEPPIVPLAFCRVDETIRAALARSGTAKVANSLSYARAGLDGWALVQGGMPLCVAHFAAAESYDRRETWPLAPGEIALMDIATEDHARGRGLAPQLIAMTARHYLDKGAPRIIAFIWWSNTPSVQAFRKAGWKRIGLSLEWRASGAWRHWHWRFPGTRLPSEHGP